MVTRAGPFPPTIAFLAHLWYAYCIVVCNAIAYGTSIVVWYCGIVVSWYCGIVVSWYCGIVVYCGGGSCLRLRCVCGAPAALCSLITRSATAVDWL